ncbi:Baculoviral IAP repeat-containing protein [Nesidiocoris tenuis]|uniref:Baculoviral IAP repeat-containing protein n=1 Tax=Nesidiocoris tenuis TaxID=355587 RepID=A0ABN7ANI7_9HEMI|nr:Baculoviral IAP repeat-containing protein [Nesidiocoris tenuis]
MKIFSIPESIAPNLDAEHPLPQFPVLPQSKALDASGPSRSLFVELVISSSFRMRTYEERLATFKKWVYGDRSKCSPHAMALSGFIFIASDTAQCYWCQKTLDGWEEHDDPWEEHKSHAPYCPYVQLFEKPPLNITIVELLELMRGQEKLKLKRRHEAICKEFETVFDNIIKRYSEPKGKKHRRLI